MNESVTDERKKQRAGQERNLFVGGGSKDLVVARA